VAISRMRWSLRAFVGLLVLAGLAVAVAACGSSSNNSSSTGQSTTGGKKGGTLTMLSNGDVDNSLDPGYSYYQYDFILDEALHRTLYAYKPDQPTQTSPDLADGQPQISNGGKTITIKIKTGVKFSPPVNRAVTSADVKYAMERDFLPQVGNGYANAYWGDIIGSKQYAAGKAKSISGIQTPDPQTIVIHLARPTAAVAVGAMALPGTAPVPKEYAAKFDRGAHSTYGQHLVTTGPYMIQNNSSGKVTGYQPGHRIVMVRNPNWDKSNDYRPAYLDKIVIEEGLDPGVGNRKVLQGQNLVGNPVDMPPPPDVLKQTVTSYKSQLLGGTYTGRFRYIALNTKVKPFDNINVRKAVIAAMNKNALRLAFGGPAVGDIATHFLSPGIAGFDEAGGKAGPNLDFMRTPNGNMQLAAQYMKKAGYPSGKYTGKAQLLMVTDNATNQKKVAEVALQTFQQLGFKINFRAVPRDTMYSKFCSVPKSNVAICPSVGWQKDFADPQTVLDPTFNGANILPTNNSNWPQLNDPNINAAMKKAEVLVDAQQRAQAWGKIDDMVVADAPGVLWIWDKGPMIRSKNVNGVVNQENAAWDLSFTSLK
jgi:peptide/nickel transport system substrate-binding protein